MIRHHPTARKIYLSDQQLQVIIDASRPLPAAKRGLLWSRTMARLNMSCTGLAVSNADVESAISGALTGLMHHRVAS
jgi:hypothetical protein